MNDKYKFQIYFILAQAYSLLKKEIQIENPEENEQE